MLRTSQLLFIALCVVVSWAQVAKQYQVKTYTGDKDKAGTDANVFITIYGEKNTSDRTQLKKSATAGHNKFEQNTTDVFDVPVAYDLGRIRKIVLEQDNSGLAAGWYVAKVEIVDFGKTYVFEVNKWLADNEDDKQTIRQVWEKSLVPELRTYTVKTYTGDKRGAGTNANAYVNIIGDRGNTTKTVLQYPTSALSDLFEANQVDSFVVQAPDLGRLRKIVIGHDNKGFGAGWYVQRVEVGVDGTTKVYTFPVDNWLADDEGDKKIERTVFEKNANDTTTDAPFIGKPGLPTTTDRFNIGKFTGTTDRFGSGGSNTGRFTDRPPTTDRFGSGGSNTGRFTDRPTTTDRFGGWTEPKPTPTPGRGGAGATTQAPSGSCPRSFDAAVSSPDGQRYFFSEGNVYRWDGRTSNLIDKQRIGDKFPNGPKTVKAALANQWNKVTLLFDDTRQVYAYTTDGKLAQGFPKRLPSTIQSTDYGFVGLGGQQILVQGDTFVTYDETSNVATTPQSRKIAEFLPGFPTDRGVKAVMNNDITQNELYVFLKDGTYMRYNQDKKAPTSTISFPLNILMKNC